MIVLYSSVFTGRCRCADQCHGVRNHGFDETLFYFRLAEYSIVELCLRLTVCSTVLSLSDALQSFEEFFWKPQGFSVARRAALYVD